MTAVLLSPRNRLHTTRSTSHGFVSTATEPTLRHARNLAETLNDYRPRMLAVARRFFGCEADCVDVVQDAYLAALRHLPSFRQECQLGTWLHRIMVNACRMKLRSTSRRPVLSLDDSNPTSRSEDSADQLSREETRQVVREALQKLSSSARTVIQLRDLEGFNTAETAEILGVSAEVVKTRLHRARQELRRFFPVDWRDQ